MAKKTETNKIPIHQWTNDDGEVLILRFSDPDGRSYGGFQHPMELGEFVTAPDWNPEPVCGGGIHGWAWGIGLGNGKDPDWKGLWQVYGVIPELVVGNVGSGPKCKFKTGPLRYKGDWQGAMNHILSGQMQWVAAVSEGAASKGKLELLRMAASLSPGGMKRNNEPKCVAPRSVLVTALTAI